MQGSQGIVRFDFHASLVVFFFALTAGTAAQAQGDEDEPQAPAAPAPAEPAPPAPPVAQPAPPPETPRAEAPAAKSPYWEQMGPDTYPGQMRGIEGGSLWLERTFHGLQWPRNSRTGIGISGMFWADSGIKTVTRDLEVPPTPNSNMDVEQARGVLRLTPTYVSGNFFVQGQAELVANGCQGQATTAGACSYAGTFTTDDLYLRVGHWNVWDLQVGRFQGWEVYHLGMGMDPFTYERMGALMAGVESNPKLEAPTLYGLNTMQDRSTDGLAVGYTALHGYFTDFLRAELLAKAGSSKHLSSNLDGSGTAYNYLGVRPTVIVDVGWLKLKLGAEWQKRTNTTQDLDPGNPPKKKDPVPERLNKGVGAALQFVLAPHFEVGVNGAYGTQSETDGMARDIPELCFTTKSVGGFANARVYDGLLVGLGLNFTELVDKFKASDDSKANNYTSHLQGFVAVQYLLARQLYIKLAAGYAQAKLQPSDANLPAWTNKMISGRLRLMYIF
jgi:hypothetical protein